MNIETKDIDRAINACDAKIERYRDGTTLHSIVNHAIYVANKETLIALKGE